MHFMFFTLKRAHLRALASARSFNQKCVPLTTSRFDMLHAIGRFGQFVDIEDESDRTKTTLKLCFEQKLLWRALGVARISVSKMVRRLIELGLLDRRPAKRDKRTFDVFLTEKGEKITRRAYRLIRKRRPFARRFTRAFGEARIHYRAVDKLDATLRKLNLHLGETAWTLYPNGKPGKPSAGTKPFVRARRAPRADKAPRLCERTRPATYRPLRRCPAVEAPAAFESARSVGSPRPP